MIRISRVKLGQSRTGYAELEEAVELCRQLYNAALEERVTSWKQRRVTIGLYDQYKSLTEIRAADERYRRLPAQMVRATALLRLHLAFCGFYRRLKVGEAPGYPRFKAKGRFSTLMFTRNGWSIEGKHLVLKFGADRIRLRMKNQIHRRGQIRGVRLVKKYDGFAVEQLDIQQMVAKPKHDTRMRFAIRRGIEDSAWRQFMRALAAKAEEAGLPFVRVNPKGTTQQCSGCGTIVHKTLRDRVHDCTACGLVLDRDVNAARNIHDRGQRSAQEHRTAVRCDGAEVGNNSTTPVQSSLLFCPKK